MGSSVGVSGGSIGVLGSPSVECCGLVSWQRLGFKAPSLTAHLLGPSDSSHGKEHPGRMPELQTYTSRDLDTMIVSVFVLMVILPFF